MKLYIVVMLVDITGILSFVAGLINLLSGYIATGIVCLCAAFIAHLYVYIVNKYPPVNPLDK